MEEEEIAATRELIQTSGTSVAINGKRRQVFVDEFMDSPAYDAGGGQIDAAALMIIGNVEDLDDVKVGMVADYKDSWRVVTVTDHAGLRVLETVNASSR